MSCNTETRPRFVPETEFAVDAALEERGFEPQVPLAKTSGLSGGTGVPQGRKGQSRRRGLYWGRPRVSNPLPSGESATLREPARVCRPSAGQGRLHGKVPAGEARAFGKDEQGGNSIVQKIPNSITQRSSRLIAFRGKPGVYDAATGSNLIPAIADARATPAPVLPQYGGGQRMRHRTNGWPGGQRLAAAVGRAARQSRGSAAVKSEGNPGRGGTRRRRQPCHGEPARARGDRAWRGHLLTPRAQDFSLASQSCVRYERARYGARRGGCCLMTFPPLACTRGSLPLGVAAEIACARRICDGSSS
jgi:hypothetical protein